MEPGKARYHDLLMSNDGGAGWRRVRERFTQKVFKEKMMKLEISRGKKWLRGRAARWHLTFQTKNPDLGKFWSVL
jgi:hypothetical protein